LVKVYRRSEETWKRPGGKVESGDISLDIAGKSVLGNVPASNVIHKLAAGIPGHDAL
jgi:hypothetical protein